MIKTSNSKQNFSIKELLPEVKENVSLAKYTTFKIGGPARYFYVAKTEKDLIKAIEAAKKCKLPFFILGGGSNLLVADKGYRGLIINFQFSIFNFQKNKVIAGAGTKLADLVKDSAEKSLTGLEWAAGIPGTVGGAIYGNAGAFGGSMDKIIKTVRVLNAASSKYQVTSIRNKDCKFGYRNSIFRRNKNLLILSCEIKLKRGDKKIILEKIKKNLKERKEVQPLDFPSAGSIFKNPKGCPAGKLIEKCGLKGKKIGGAKISEKHANFIVNLGGARAKDVKKLIDLIKKKVENKFGITLKEEIEFLGF